MRRRYAIPLALLWVMTLVAVDLWCLVEFRVADTHLKRILAEMFEAPVSFGDLSLSATGDIVLADVRMMRPDARKRVYGTIDEVRVTPKWSELLTAFVVDVKEIAVQNPTLVVKWKDDRTFDMPSPLRSDLEARTRTMGELPAIKLKGLTLVLENPPDVVNEKLRDIVFEQLSITLAPEGSARWLYRFDVDVDHPLLGHVTGGGNFSKDAFEVHLRHRGLSVSSALVDALRPDLAKVLGDLEVEGELTVSAEIGPVRGGTAEALTAALDCEGVNVRSKTWGLALSAIRGHVDFEGGVMSSAGLTTVFEGAPVEVRGNVDLSGGTRIVDVHGHVVGLPVSSGLAAKIRKLPDPCPTIADQIEAWDPTAFADVRFRLAQAREETGEPGVLHPFIEVEFRGGSKIRYVGHVGDDGERHGFAYPLEDVRGVLRFTDVELVFDRLTALNGSLAVEARGRIDYEHKGDESYDVDVDAHGLRLDGRVSDALSGASRDLFNSLDAEGSADLTVAVKRKKTEPPGARVDIAVDLHGVALRPRQLPLDLADARGRILIPDTGALELERVTARRQGGTVTLDGSIPVTRGQGPLDLQIGFQKFPLDSALAVALKELAPDAAGTLAELNPAGRVDGLLHVGVGIDGSLTDLSGTIAFDDLALSPEDPSLRITEVEGSVGIANSKITINQGTTASIAGEHFAVKGFVEESRFDLSIEAENFHVDRELLAEVEPLLPWIRRFKTRPEVDGQMSISLQVASEDSNTEVSFTLDCLGVDVGLASSPALRVDDLRGHCEMTRDGVVSFRDVAGRVPLPGAETRPNGDEVVTGAVERERPPVAVTVASGTWTPAAKETKPPARGNLLLGPSTIQGLEISPGFFAILPASEDLKQRLEKIAPAAVIDLAFGKLTWDGSEVVVDRSRLVASRLSIGEERTIRMESATVSRMNATIGSGYLDLAGEFTFRDCRFADVPVPMMIGKLGADAAGIRFESIEADLFGYETREGNRYALGKINPETSRLEIGFDTGSFDSRLQLQEVNIPAAIRSLGGDPGKVAGTFRSRLNLQGALGEDGTYTGQGDLSVRARNVVSLPVFYRMFNSLDVLSIFERSDPWTKIEVGFDVENRVIKMGRIRIDSPDILLEGPGTLTFAGNVKADLKANQGVGISPIGWVTRLISHVVFAGVRIDGPLDDPRVNAYSITGG